MPGFRTLGINRLSVGVQSFDNTLLKAMGRTLFKGEDSIEKLKLAQGKFDTVNVDLMFNFPTQTPEQFHADVKTIQGPGHRPGHLLPAHAVTA